MTNILELLIIWFLIMVRHIGNGVLQIYYTEFHLGNIIQL